MAQWSKRANMWRGDRALGGRLAVVDDRLVFEPHRLDRALGGDSAFSSPLAQVTSLGKAPRSRRVPRQRLVVTTADGVQACFLVNGLDEAIVEVERQISAAGGTAAILSPEEVDGPPPEMTPDDSAFMNLLRAGWMALVALAIAVLFLAGAVAGSASPVVLVLLTALVALFLWQTVTGFARSARVRARR